MPGLTKAGHFSFSGRWLWLYVYHGLQSVLLQNNGLKSVVHLRVEILADGSDNYC